MVSISSSLLLSIHLLNTLDISFPNTLQNLLEFSEVSSKKSVENSFNIVEIQYKWRKIKQ